jgi:hypothetical protein
MVVRQIARNPADTVVCCLQILTARTLISQHLFTFLLFPGSPGTPPSFSDSASGALLTPLL